VKEGAQICTSEGNTVGKKANPKIPDDEEQQPIFSDETRETILQAFLGRGSCPKPERKNDSESSESSTQE